MNAINFIDKLAYIHIVNGEILMALGKGKQTYYIPGGKREEVESDEQALIREVKEEFTVHLIPETIEFYGVFSAQAHDKPEGVMVRMTCYTADYIGDIKPSSEIEEIAYYTYAQKDIVSPVGKIIFDDLKNKCLIN